jgi:ADP-heptose:LPS heptosyltransferase
MRMYRNNTELLFDTKMNFVLNHGALGDMITSLPAIIHARLNRSDMVTLTVWVGKWQVDLVDHLLKPYGKFRVKDITEFPMKAIERKDWDGGPVAINTAFKNTHTRNRVHMVDYAFNFLIDAQPENMAQRSYPVLAPIGELADCADKSIGQMLKGERYVVFPIGATSDNKLFKASLMAPIMEWCLENSYQPVIVGTKTSHTMVEAQGDLAPIVLRDELDKLPDGMIHRCIDLREKTTLLELRDVCGHAKAVVGVDGGTLHIAGTTDTNIVYGLTTTLPKHRYIARFGEPEYKVKYVVPRNLECAGCQSNWVLVPWHDFRNCAYDDNKCTDMLHHEDFINGLKELGL